MSGWEDGPKLDRDSFDELMAQIYQKYPKQDAFTLETEDAWFEQLQHHSADIVAAAVRWYCTRHDFMPASINAFRKAMGVVIREQRDADREEALLSGPPVSTPAVARVGFAMLNDCLAPHLGGTGELVGVGLQTPTDYDREFAYRLKRAGALDEVGGQYGRRLRGLAGVGS